MAITINKQNRADDVYDVTCGNGDADDLVLAALNGAATGSGKAAREDKVWAEKIGTNRYLCSAGVLRQQGVSGFAAPQYTGDAAAYTFKGV